MPASIVASFAKRTGTPVAHVEKLWGQAKQAVKKQYKMDEPDAGSPESTRYYRLAVGILKRMLRIKEEHRPLISDALVEELRSLGMGQIAEQLEG